MECDKEISQIGKEPSKKKDPPKSIYHPNEGPLNTHCVSNKILGEKLKVRAYNLPAL